MDSCGEKSGRPSRDAEPSAQDAPAWTVGLYSVVVPFYNEEAVVEELVDKLRQVMDRIGRPYELVLVNDGSRDRTGDILDTLARSDRHVAYIELNRNFGQTTALQAGFDHARGDVIIAMDGDLQHDPQEIPLFIQKINEGFDIVSGWRMQRQDHLLMRRLPSGVANWLLAKASGVNVHDFGTTFKAYRREVLQEVRLYGDMHRFVPAACARLGARICEVPISNPPRQAGKSNYGIGRMLHVTLDIITTRFITGYLTRPLHFFGKWGLIAGLVGAAILGYGFVRKVLQWNSFHLMQEHGPLMAVGFMLVITATLFVATGLIGELLMRIYFEATRARTYAVRRIIRSGESRSGR